MWRARNPPRRRLRGAAQSIDRDMEARWKPEVETRSETRLTKGGEKRGVRTEHTHTECAGASSGGGKGTRTLRNAMTGMQSSKEPLTTVKTMQREGP